VLGFPLLLVPFAIYNMIAFIFAPFDWGYAPYSFPLKSGGLWAPSVSDAFLVFSLLMLLFEFIKATRYGKSLVEHFLSVVLAGGAAAEFVMVKEVGSSLSILLLFVAICFVDMFAGFAASLRRARRRAAEAAPPAYVEPVPLRPAPAPAPVVPVAPAVRAEPLKVDPAMPAATMPVVKVDPVQKIEP
jgi:hypothetical protein